MKKIEIIAKPFCSVVLLKYRKNHYINLATWNISFLDFHHNSSVDKSSKTNSLMTKSIKKMLV